jgi:hypothetical protein
MTGKTRAQMRRENDFARPPRCAGQDRGSMTDKPKTLTTERYVARFNAEKARLARHYCTIFKFWRGCPRKSCRKMRTCGGDPHVCLKRGEPEVPRDIQWNARQQVIAATPAHAGAHGARVSSERFGCASASRCGGRMIARGKTGAQSTTAGRAQRRSRPC